MNARHVARHEASLVESFREGCQFQSPCPRQQRTRGAGGQGLYQGTGLLELPFLWTYTNLVLPRLWPRLLHSMSTWVLHLHRHALLVSGKLIRLPKSCKKPHDACPKKLNAERPGLHRGARQAG